MLDKNKSTIDDVIAEFVSSLSIEQMEAFKKYIPNPMLTQEIDFYKLIVELFDLKRTGYWIAEMIANSDPFEASLMRKYTATGESTLEWEVGLLIKKIREKLGITFEWQEAAFGNAR